MHPDGVPIKKAFQLATERPGGLVLLRGNVPEEIRQIASGTLPSWHKHR